MVQIVFLFCLIASPTQCEEHRLPGIALNTMNECMTNGQTMAITWLDDHPKWALSRWRCVTGGGAGEPA